MASIRYRALAASDVDAVRALYGEYRTANSDRATVASWLDTHPSVGAFAGERLAGFVYTRKIAPEILEIDNLYIGRGFRDAGIGAELLTRVELLAKKSGYQGVFLTNAMSYPAREARRSPGTFYLRNGYTAALACATTTVFVKSLA